MSASNFFSSLLKSKDKGSAYICSIPDSDEEQDDEYFEEDDMFSRLEATRAKLETELGCDKFLQAYKTVQVSCLAVLCLYMAGQYYTASHCDITRTPEL